MNETTRKILTRLAPILGAGSIGVCPLCWSGSASLLTYIGLGVLIPFWRWIAFGILFLGAVGFILDYRAHGKPLPLVLLIIGGFLLYLRRYVYGGAVFDGWPIWGLGGVLIVVAVFHNRSFFGRNSSFYDQKHSFFKKQKSI